MSPTERANQSQALCTRLCSLDEVVQASTVALFVGVGHEPQTRGVFDVLAPRGRWLPKVVGPTALAWGQVHRWDDLRPGRFGIPEPSVTHDALPEDIEVVLVPGLAFDREGGRLGWGRGYYDRALDTVPHAVRIGLCLTPGLVPRVPMEAHDFRMHWVVTPSATYRGENAQDKLR